MVWTTTACRLSFTRGAVATRDPPTTFSQLVRRIPGLQRDRERMITEACRRAAGDDPLIWAMVQAVQDQWKGIGEAGALRLVAAIGVRWIVIQHEQKD